MTFFFYGVISPPKFDFRLLCSSFTFDIGLHNATLEFYFRHWSFTMRHWSFTFDILVTLFNIYFSFATYDHVNSNNKNTVSRCKMVVFQAPFVFHVFNSTAVIRRASLIILLEFHFSSSDTHECFEHHSRRNPLY